MIEPAWSKMERPCPSRNLARCLTKPTNRSRGVEYHSLMSHHLRAARESRNRGSHRGNEGGWVRGCGPSFTVTRWQRSPMLYCRHNNRHIVESLHQGEVVGRGKSWIYIQESRSRGSYRHESFNQRSNNVSPGSRFVER